MLDSPVMKRMGVTPAKLVLVAVLAVILVVVVVVQWPGGKTTTATNPNPPVLTANPQNDSPALTEVSHVTRPADAPRRAPSRTQSAWPQIAVEEAVRHNPFLLPIEMRTAPQRDADPSNPDSQQIPQELTQAKSGVILMVGQEHVARVGATTVRPGDKFGRWRVSKIDSTGVWLVDESHAPP